MAAVPKNLEKLVEEQERFARLESKVEHVQSDVTELKADLRAALAKFDAIKDGVSEMQASRGFDRVWWSRPVHRISAHRFCEIVSGT